MDTMSQQQYPSGMYQDYMPSRSPTRNYNSATLGRQPARPFESYGPVLQPSGLYTAEDHARQELDNRMRFDGGRTVSAAMHSHYGYDTGTWNYGAQNAGRATMASATARMKPTRRAGLPNVWLDSEIPPVPQMPMPHMNGQYGVPELHNYVGRMSPPPPPPSDDDLIPTAIVIKNIPFAVKKESLTEFMANMGLPLPYAFNYHFDAGVFRGLAFANYTTSEETAIVIQRMNYQDIGGRKLRVEYKKMLPAAERERIERDKRERRGQLQEQHQPLSTSSLHTQSSVNSMNSIIPTNSPSPLTSRADAKFMHDIDMNDPVILGFYTDLMMFKGDASRETHIFPSTVSPAERRIIHTLAHHMGLEHRSEGVGDMRQVQILRARPNHMPQTSQAHHASAAYFNESQKRGLNRAATIDFGETRVHDPYYNHTLGRQGSGLLDIPGSPGLGMNAQNLRAAKSFADLRSYTPSPVPSSASFPAGLTQNIARFGEYQLPTASSGTPNLTPTSAGGMPNRDDFIVSNMNSLNLGFDRQNNNNNRANGGRIGQEREAHGTTAGAIGSQRPSIGNANGNGIATSFDDSPWKNSSLDSAVASERQTRAGPGADWGGAFGRPRQNGHMHRGSDSSDRNVQASRFH